MNDCTDQGYDTWGLFVMVYRWYSPTPTYSDSTQAELISTSSNGTGFSYVWEITVGM